MQNEMRDRLMELLDKAFLESNDNYGMPCTDQVADYLIENGVVCLPCKVGSTIYRIDYIRNPCSHEGVCYDEFYCRNCLLLECGACDYRKEPYIYKIENANAQTILGNEHLIGTRAFLTKEDAEQKLKGGTKE